jgi:hypothetical protein
MQSIFLNKNEMPGDDDLKTALGKTHKWWQAIKEYVLLKYPRGVEKWSCSNYGWSYKIMDKKRAIIYLLPRDQFFKVAFVFGQKATGIILQGNISNIIKQELKSAKVYAEGRGIRLAVTDDSLINDINELINIKLGN